MSFYPFNESGGNFLVFTSVQESNGLVDPVYERSYEQLITERGDFVIKNVNENYDDIFNKIKSKLFNLNRDIVIVEKEEFSKKYQTGDFFNLLKNIKKEVVFLYNKKIEQELLLSERKKSYTSFCNNITESLKIINDDFKETDENFKKVLSDKIDEYYNTLDFDVLTENLENTINEFEYAKRIIASICNVSPQTCTVCMDNQVTDYYNPCGHTICGDCKGKYSLKTCHYCRSHIDKISKLFF